jgi:hypothetical protein
VPSLAADHPPVAVALNVTAVTPSAFGFLTVWDNGAQQPFTSNVNYPNAGATPNMVIAKLGANGAINVASSAGCPQLVIDVVGWYIDAPPPRGSISGTVTVAEASADSVQAAAEENPLDGYCVYAVAQGAETLPPMAQIADDGTYQIDDLTADNYSVVVDVCSDPLAEEGPHAEDYTLADQTYDGLPGYPNVGGEYGTDVAVTANHDTSGIDFELAPGGRLRLVPTPAANVAPLPILSTANASGSTFYFTKQSDGSYLSFPLTSGVSMKVLVYRLDGSGPVWVGGASKAAATAFTVPGAGEVLDVPFAVPSA